MTSAWLRGPVKERWERFAIRQGNVEPLAVVLLRTMGSGRTPARRAAGQPERADGGEGQLIIGAQRLGRPTPTCPRRERRGRSSAAIGGVTHSGYWAPDTSAARSRSRTRGLLSRRLQTARLLVLPPSPGRQVRHTRNIWRQRHGGSWPTLSPVRRAVCRSSRSARVAFPSRPGGSGARRPI
jgi:hypothetical protein